MILIDSNLIILAARTDQLEIRQFIIHCLPSVSAISYIEVL